MFSSLKQPLLTLNFYKLTISYIKNKCDKYSKLIILLHVTIIYAPEVIYNCYICMGELLYNDMLLHISSQLHVQWVHIDRLKSATVEVFTFCKLAHAAKSGLVFVFLVFFQRAIKRL